METSKVSEAEPITPDWLAQVRERDEAASRRLVERLYPMVLRIVRAHRPGRWLRKTFARKFS